MNGPQRTAVSRKELWQKWKQRGHLSYLNITGFVRQGHTCHRSGSCACPNIVSAYLKL